MARGSDCPRQKITCVDPVCGMGAACHSMRAIGLAGDGTPPKRKLRPRCGAQNRQGRPCAVRVEPGKARCRFHGGLSSGPRTADGKARIGAIGTAAADAACRVFVLSAPCVLPFSQRSLNQVMKIAVTCFLYRTDYPRWMGHAQNRNRRPDC
jgi:hypothetical protein